MTVRWWFAQTWSNPAVSLEAAILGSYAALSNLVLRGRRAHANMTMPIKTTGYGNRCPDSYLPHWQSPRTPHSRFPHLQMIPDPSVWARFGVTKIQHVIPNGKLLPYDTLKTTFQFPSWMFFRFLQLRHAIQSQFPQIPTVASHIIESYLMSRHADRILSSLYLRISSRDTNQNTELFQRWQSDIPNLESEDWDEGVQQYIPLMISARDRYIQLKFLHKVYYTPQKLARIYPTQSDRCPKCRNELGTFNACNLVLPLTTRILERSGKWD